MTVCPFNGMLMQSELTEGYLNSLGEPTCVDYCLLLARAHALNVTC